MKKLIISIDVAIFIATTVYLHAFNGMTIVRLVTTHKWLVEAVIFMAVPHVILSIAGITRLIINKAFHEEKIVALPLWAILLVGHAPGLLWWGTEHLSLITSFSSVGIAIWALILHGQSGFGLLPLILILQKKQRIHHDNLDPKALGKGLFGSYHLVQRTQLTRLLDTHASSARRRGFLIIKKTAFGQGSTSDIGKCQNANNFNSFFPIGSD